METKKQRIVKCQIMGCNKHSDYILPVKLRSESACGYIIKRMGYCEEHLPDMTGLVIGEAPGIT